MNSEKYKTYYHRNLPHYQPPGYVFSTIFRLTDSIPVSVIKKFQDDASLELKRIASIKDKKEKSLEYVKYQYKYFAKYEHYLNKAKYGPQWLKDEKVCELVFQAIKFYDTKKYNIVAFTLMPNHVHLIIQPIVPNKSDVEMNKTPMDNASRYILTKCLQDLKRYTAVKSNEILGRSGAFWHHESYDHVVRDKKELRRIVKYILNNPVKAGLVDSWEEWKWSYYNPEYLI